jgi:two-component system CheB/CheR fusion protein
MIEMLNLACFLRKAEHLGLAAVIIALSPPAARDEKILMPALSASSGLPVMVPRDGDMLQPGHVYLAPQDARITIAEQRFQLLRQEDDAGRDAIDDTFSALAMVCGTAATAILFGDAGGDGTRGLAAIREAGGLAMAGARGADAPDQVERVAQVVGTPEDLAARVDQQLTTLCAGEVSLTPIALAPQKAQHLTNKEMESSKDELGSVNEELRKTNAELSGRLQELARANSDLKNLFESTEIATVFLDSDLRIERFTPAARNIFHLTSGDLGRPLSHIRSSVFYPELETDAREVLASLQLVERDTGDIDNGQHYLTRVLPYRNLENVVQGVVLTFLDVTPLMCAEEKLRNSELRLRTIVEGMPQLVWRSVDMGSWVWSSPQWSEFTGQDAAAAAGSGWLSAVHPDDRAKVLEAWTNAPKRGGLDVDHRLYHQRDDSYRSVRTRSVPVRLDSGAIFEWLGTSTDVHELMELHRKQGILLAELQHRVRNTLAVIRSIARRTAVASRTVDDYAMHLEGRIDALARAHAVMTRTPDAMMDLETLLLDEFNGRGARESQITVRGPTIELHGKAAENLSLAFHELSTNSIKYGALGTNEGHIGVEWNVDRSGQEPAVSLSWTETAPGIGPKLTRRGFGLELVERLIPHELDGTGALTFSQGRLICKMQLPLSDLVRSNLKPAG